MGEFRRNMQDLVNNPRGYLEMIADRLQNASKGRRAVINDQGAGYRNLTQQERLQAVQQVAMDNLGGGGLGIIKAKGGNWLTGSVENALKGLKRRMDPELEGYARRGQNLMPHEAADVVPKISLNDWIEGPLTKYVKRDMATEGDPVRKLAEQGISHIQPGYIPEGTEAILRGNAATNRMRASQDLSGIGISPEAQLWETMSDAAVIPGSAKSRIQYHGATNPWLEKLAPEELVHHYSNPTGELGFNHLTDELVNALNPESGLPRHLQLTPEQMQQLGMEKAVRHVDAINKWRAAQQAEANLAKSQSPAVHMVREYAENNPKGLRWTELRQPEAKLEEGWKVVPQGSSGLFEVVDDLGRQRSVGATEQEAVSLLNRTERKQLLADQLKYEGDTMGHCVGGYCDDVASGRSRIFSLRDAKGEPHVTIETQPTSGYGDYLESIEGSGLPDSIVQIKGKQNLKPKDEYLPFVQDFVKSGKWSDVGDLSNTGLFRTDKLRKGATLGLPEADYQALHKAMYQANPDLVSFSQGLSELIPEGAEYMTRDELMNLIKPKQNFASGGSVKSNTTWRPMELDGIIGYITE